MFTSGTSSKMDVRGIGWDGGADANLGVDADATLDAKVKNDCGIDDMC